MVHRAVRGGVEDRWVKKVRQDDGSWTEVPSAKHGVPARWRARYVTGEGKETEKVFAVKREAEVWLRARLAEVDSGTHIPRAKTKITVADVNKERSKGQAHIAKSTAIQRASTWKVYVEPKWGSRPVGEVKTSAVRAWIAALVEQEVGVPSIENAHGLLRMILDAAVEDGRLPRNPAAGIRLPKRTHPDRGYLSHQQLRELAEHCEDDGLVVLTLGYTGLRWSEMSALRVQDVDLGRRRINVSRAVVEASKLDWKTPKSHERRSVPFPQALADLLAEQVKGKGREDLVFTNTRGEVLRVGTWRNRVFRPALARCRAADPTFPTITPHDLRHTAASLAISAGANVLGVQRMLGHSKASMTLDVYSDLFDSDLDAVAANLDAAITALDADSAGENPAGDGNFTENSCGITAGLKLANEASTGDNRPSNSIDADRN